MTISSLTVRDDPVGATGITGTIANRLDLLTQNQISGEVGFTTVALMNANLAFGDKTVALVTADPTPANNGYYLKSGASGAGSWVGPGVDRVAAGDAVNAANIAVNASAVALLQFSASSSRTLVAERSLREMRTFDAAGLSVPGRPSAISVAASMLFATPLYTHGIAETDFGLFEFARGSTGEAIGGGTRQTFAVNQPRIFGGELKLDSGGANLLLYSEDYAQSNWVKTACTVGAAADSPAGVGTARRIEETSANSTHELRQTVSTTALTFTHTVMIKPGERTLYRLNISSNATGSPGARADYNLSGAGSVSAVFGTGGGPIGTSVVAAIDAPDAYGFYLLRLSVTLPSAPTSVLIYHYPMSAANTITYAGTAGYGATFFGPMFQAAAQPVSYIASTATQGTRSAETCNIPLGKGTYLSRVVDEVGEVLAQLVLTVIGQRWPLAARAGRYRIAKAAAYVLNVYDTLTRADTADGTLGIADDGGTYYLREYPGSFPLVAATHGRISGNHFVVTPAIGQPGTVYAVRDLGVGAIAKFASCNIKFDPPVIVGTTTNTSATILFSNSLSNLTEVMPSHNVGSRSALVIQKRDSAGNFVTLGTITHALAANGATEYPLSIAIHGNTATVTFNGRSVTVQDADFLNPCRYVCWEIQAPNSATTDLAKMSSFIATTAEVGDAVTYVAAAPINDQLPFASGTPVSGNTYSISNTRGWYRSNAGQITYTQQWQFDGVDVVGQTGATFVTTAGTDAGKKVSVRETATNSAGSTSVTSLQSAALA